MFDKTYPSNKIFSQLPEETRDALAFEAKPIEYTRGAVLAEADDCLGKVIFPDNGVVTLAMPTSSGKFIGVGLVGVEGLIGETIEPRLGSNYLRIVAASAVTGKAVGANKFRSLISEHPALRDACADHIQLLLKQARNFAVCNTIHTAEMRLASRLLQFDDRLDGGMIRLTHSDISEMLGVRRVTITEAAKHLETVGAIAYSRGVIRIISRAALEDLACDCHEHIGFIRRAQLQRTIQH